MTLVQWIVLAAVALIAAVPGMMFIPRQKRAQPFEVVMWIAAWIVALLSAWLTLGAMQSMATFRFLVLFPVYDIPLVPALLGAFGGVLILTVPLWLMDHFGMTDANVDENDTELD